MGTTCQLVLCLCLLFGLVNTQVPDSAIKLLYDRLFVNSSYNSKVRPQVNWTETTVVNTSLVVVNLIGYDEVREKLSLTGKLVIEWVDEYLSWDPSLYDGLTYINIPQHDIWRPNVTLENSVTTYVDLGSLAMFVMVNYTGHVIWKPMAELHSSCIADVKRFPLDVQHCLLKFEVWSHPTDAVLLRTTDNYVKLHGYNGLPEWEITQTEASILKEDGDVYAGFRITLTRKPLYIFINVILPITAISLLGQCVFLLPLESGEKASFSVTVLLSLAVFLTIVSQSLPKTSDNISVFNVFVFTQVLVCTLATVITLLQSRLFHTEDEARLPMGILVSLRLWKRSPNHVRSNSTCGQNRGNSGSVVSVVDMKDGVPSEDADDGRIKSVLPVVTWRGVAVWIDLRAFLLCFLLNMIVTICLLIV